MCTNSRSDSWLRQNIGLEEEEFEEGQIEPAADEPPHDELNEAEETGESREDRDWGFAEAISDQAFSELVNQHVEKQGKVSDKPFCVKYRVHGSYNYVAILGNGTSKLIVKIPIVGSKERWDPAHAQIIRSEAHTLMYIKHKLPHFPCPELLAKDATFDNAIGAPFLMLSYLEGQEAHYLWHGDHIYNNELSQELEAKRTTFLSSLATIIAELRHLEFDSIGMLYLDDETNPDSVYIGPRQDFVGMLNREYYEWPVFKSSAAFYDWRHTERCGEHTSGADFMRAELLKSVPFATSKKRQTDTQETFTLSLSDLALQNIFVNHAGEVTGIIDWDDATVLPRCVGFTTVPVFLQGHLSAMSPSNLTKYCKAYAAAMKKACSDCEEAARYCEKSALYMEIHDMMYGYQDYWKDSEAALMKKLLLEIPKLRSANLDMFLLELHDENSEFWTEVCELWANQIPKILDPETK